MSWESCSICGKKSNGYYNANNHQGREHPGPEWFASQERYIEGTKADIDTLKEHRQEYESLEREYQQPEPREGSGLW